jgi:hypothetical protein
MSVKQISIFVENKPGKLAELTQFMAKHEINLRALSLADTQDFGILRIITGRPERADEILQEAGYITKLNNVLAVALPDKPGALADILQRLADAQVNVEYTYAFTSFKPGAAYMIFRVDDRHKAEEVLQQGSVRLVSQEDIFA